MPLWKFPVLPEIPWFELCTQTLFIVSKLPTEKMENPEASRERERENLVDDTFR